MMNILIFLFSFIPLNFIEYKRPIVKPILIQLDDEESLQQSLEPPAGGELKLLTYIGAENWAHKWLLYIANSGVEYNDNYYNDYFTMKGMTNMYTSPEYFYLGYFPDSRITFEGPKYIGLFELQYKKRIFNAKCIIENPFYMEDESELLYFKELIIQLTESAYVFFNYKILINQDRLDIC